jgi:hypothetical protein
MRPSFALALALVALTPGCLTAGLWEWAREEGQDLYKAAAIEEVAPAPDGGYVVRLRMADGSERQEVWPGEDLRGPTWAFSEACRDAGRGRLFADSAVGHLERAVRRGLALRDFASEPALASIAGREEVARLALEPVRPPELILRDPDPSTLIAKDEGGWVHVVLLAPPEPPAAVIDVRPVEVEVWRGGPLGYTAAALATPVTFVVDVVTFPAQVVIVLWILDDLFDF